MDKIKTILILIAIILGDSGHFYDDWFPLLTAAVPFVGRRHRPGGLYRYSDFK